MIDFTSVSREFNSLVDRRRELLTLLGSVFAGLGIFLQNALQGNLPPALRPIETHLFAFYALVLMVCSLVLSLRMARLHGGMVLNGVLYAGLMRGQDFGRPGDPKRAARHNYLGASFLQFVLVDLIAGFSAAVLASALGANGLVALVLGAAVLLVWMGLYFRFHHRAATFAFKKIDAETAGPVTRQEWEEHATASLERTNKDMLGTIGFVGLMLFSALETMSGLGSIKLREGADLRSDDIQSFGPAIYTTFMVVTCLLSLLIYLRLRIAVGRQSLDLDPTDRPFRPFRLTDSFLGYLLLVFLFGVSLHLLLVVIVPEWGEFPAPALAIDAVALTLAILAEPITLILAADAHQRTFTRNQIT